MRQVDDVKLLEATSRPGKKSEQVVECRVMEVCFGDVQNAEGRESHGGDGEDTIQRIFLGLIERENQVLQMRKRQRC